MRNMNKFNIGDKVIYTNDNGVCFGEKTITDVREISYSETGYGYKIEPTDTPWYYFKEEEFTKVEGVK